MAVLLGINNGALAHKLCHIHLKAIPKWQPIFHEHRGQGHSFAVVSALQIRDKSLALSTSASMLVFKQWKSKKENLYEGNVFSSCIRLPLRWATARTAIMLCCLHWCQFGFNFFLLGIKFQLQFMAEILLQQSFGIVKIMLQHQNFHTTQCVGIQPVGVYHVLIVNTVLYAFRAQQSTGYLCFVRKRITCHCHPCHLRYSFQIYVRTNVLASIHA